MTGLRLHQSGVVGAGRVAQALALALAPHSTLPPIMWGRSPERTAAAATRIGAIAAPAIGQLMTQCDVIAIAVSDDALAGVVSEMAAISSASRGSLIFHVSGRSGAAILDPLRSAGALTAAIHPAMTFTGDPAGEVQRMAGARFAITGSTADATESAKQFVALLGGIAVEIAEDRRALYHAALCHASNHLVTLIAGASHALEDAGVDDPAALLAPLVRAALENSLAFGFAGLSGPLLRGDARTVGDHLATLTAHSPALLPAYRAMALATLDELKRAGNLPSDRLTALDSLLAVP
ncbi:Rossmann-like and DUF2520 domain-containing protein [Sphingopyxis sp.]|jgi:predicted short-subunit dehydrogenase-like oxidoreductase (DUF2520 family)|uniref:Rossmann-like and DUF2520 domain-containing protein n=1 Tax=Sphingopyxis sp. TaxID=1908224 RepID=UPI002E066640|nr:Rossmann-like and DUF2520 domain-containing protein [Sphingopyxis sp.]